MDSIGEAWLQVMAEGVLMWLQSWRDSYRKHSLNVQVYRSINFGSVVMQKMIKTTIGIMDTHGHASLILFFLGKMLFHNFWSLISQDMNSVAVCYHFDAAGIKRHSFNKFVPFSYSLIFFLFLYWSFIFLFFYLNLYSNSKNTEVTLSVVEFTTFKFNYI